MKKQMTLSILISVISCFVLMPAHASDKPATIRYFVPGKYELIEGEQNLCGEGDFHLSADGSRVWLGPYYSFRTMNGIDSGKGGLANEKDCLYSSETSHEVKGQQTIFTDATTVTCGTKKRQVVTNTATITKHKIVLDQSTWADTDQNPNGGGSPHHCAWRAAKGK